MCLVPAGAARWTVLGNAEMQPVDGWTRGARSQVARLAHLVGGTGVARAVATAGWLQSISLDQLAEARSKPLVAGEIAGRGQCVVGAMPQWLLLHWRVVQRSLLWPTDLGTPTQAGVIVQYPPRCDNFLEKQHAA